ncbi:MAG: hypothetical protein H6Q90_5033 [Deltaproteobacteria bacterium]|nr:hypothetical protein [Deltaproteobacteria bacterium]
MIRSRPIALVVLAMAAACSSVSTVRVQPEHVYVGPNMHPIAVIHAQVTRGYILFLPLGSPVNLDRVVNRMLLATAKALGADKVVNITVDVTPNDGIWTLRKILGWQSAQASGVAVVVDEPAPGAAPPVKAAP